jgi:PAS domain-containing protein
MLQIVEKMFSHSTYEFDTVVTFIRGEYRKATRKRDMVTEEGGDDETFSSHFILCSVNKTDQPKKALLFDYIEKEFKKDGSESWITTTKMPLLNTKGEVVGTFGMSRDITKVKCLKRNITLPSWIRQ